MNIIHTQENLAAAVAAAKAEGKIVGLVPTMGALHEGHASLIERCADECDLTVVSIFVNPTQFNDPNDLRNYPRTLDADCHLVESKGGDIVFAPDVAEIYPEPDQRRFSYPPIDTVADQNFHFTLVSCPIVREESGLALSSRNTLLTEEERCVAANINRVLQESKLYRQTHTLVETREYVTDTLNRIEGLEVEYYEIVDAFTLTPLTDWKESKHIQGCITVYCGARPVRLIDNVSYQ